MSVPRRLSLRHIDGVYVLRQEIVAPAIAGVPQANLHASTVPAAAKLELPGDRDFRLAIADTEGRSLEIELRGAQLLVSRRDPSLPGLDAVQSMQVQTTAEIAIWLDCGSLELLADHGCAALSVQHRLAGSSYALVCAVEPVAA